MIADVAAQAATHQYLRGDVDGDDLVAVSRAAVEIEPQRPLWWYRLGARQMGLERLADARASLLRATELQEWRPDAWILLAELGRQTGDAELARDAEFHICAMDLGSASCDPLRS